MNIGDLLDDNYISAANYYEYSQPEVQRVLGGEEGLDYFQFIQIFVLWLYQVRYAEVDQQDKVNLNYQYIFGGQLQEQDQQNYQYDDYNNNNSNMYNNDNNSNMYNNNYDNSNMYNNNDNNSKMYNNDNNNMYNNDNNNNMYNNDNDNNSNM